jgi:hypothetical protein
VGTIYWDLSSAAAPIRSIRFDPLGSAETVKKWSYNLYSAKAPVPKPGGNVHTACKSGVANHGQE